MITDRATDRVMPRCIQTVAVGQETHAVMQPISMTGHAFKACPSAKHAGPARHDSTAINRGVEGGIVPAQKQAARIFWYYGGADEQRGDQPGRAIPIPKDAPSATTRDRGIATTAGTDTVSRAAANAGLEALPGKAGAAHDSLADAGTLMSHHPGHHESMESVAVAGCCRD